MLEVTWARCSPNIPPPLLPPTPHLLTPPPHLLPLHPYLPIQSHLGLWFRNQQSGTPIFLSYFFPLHFLKINHLKALKLCNSDSMKNNCDQIGFYWELELCMSQRLALGGTCAGLPWAEGVWPPRKWQGMLCTEPLPVLTLPSLTANVPLPLSLTRTLVMTVGPPG